jgi:hypothetical protein
VDDTLGRVFKELLVCAADYIESSKNVGNISEFSAIVMAVSKSVTTLEAKFTGDTAFHRFLIRNTQIRDQFMRSKAKLTKELEDLILSGMQKCIDASVAQCKKVLSQYQKKTDFTDGERDQASVASAECTRLIKIAATPYRRDEVRNRSDKKSAEMYDRTMLPFYTILASKLLDAVMDHLLHFKYTALGAVTCLIMDTDAYVRAFDAFSLESVSEKVREMDAIAKQVMTQTGAGLVDSVKRFQFSSPAAVIYTKKWLEMRTDVKQSEISFLEPGSVNIRRKPVIA